jgi:glyoxylase-like metal-dependent hydrolase (beta-lactamase superfamily II)
MKGLIIVIGGAARVASLPLSPSRRRQFEMKITKHGPHLTKVTRLGFVNVFLVREEDGLTLVDTALSGSAKGILAAADEAGAPIVRIVITHAHRDHAGSLDKLAAALPGHTPGQIALLDVRNRTLIGADAYSTLGRVATTAKPTLPFPLPAIASWHRPTALVSARELRALNPSRLAVGHGPVVERPGDAMESALRAAGA